MSVSAETSFFGLLGVSFSASADYQSLFSEGQTGMYGYAGTTTVCTSYSAAWNQFAFQPNFTLTGNFLDGVAKLNASVSWLEFATAFGKNRALERTPGGMCT